MVISNVIGGLGNQMFQYATGRALSLRKESSHLVDISDFGNYRRHQGFELLRVFACPLKIATAADIGRVLGWQAAPFMRKLMRRSALAVIRRSTFLVEPHFHYWPGLHNAPKDSYLAGYWQSEKYFQEAAQAIRADFCFKATLSPRNAELAEQIAKGNTVSLHVRRGDYVRDPKTSATLGLCFLDYYYSAIKYITVRISQPNFFVFSDDPAWVQKHLRIDFPCRYVDHNLGAESYNDMRLMSLCRHHIIANSSFSWWGAWLNPRPDKIVIAPKKWFTNGYSTEDLLPDDWIVL